jgi:hypothetical protein
MIKDNLLWGAIAIVAILAVLTISGCSFFEKDKLQIDAQAISSVKSNVPGDYAITVSNNYENRSYEIKVVFSGDFFEGGDVSGSVSTAQAGVNAVGENTYETQVDANTVKTLAFKITAVLNKSYDTSRTIQVDTYKKEGGVWIQYPKEPKIFRIKVTKQ